MISRLLATVDRLRPPVIASAHCDLPCGVYDPAQARIEAESVKNCQTKFQDSDDPVFRQRAIQIKEERADLVKHHLWVLWTDYFKPNHLESYPELHEKFWQATKLAGDAKKSEDPSQGQELLDAIAEIDRIFWETKKA
jgi:nickel superoxide dismutase